MNKPDNPLGIPPNALAKKLLRDRTKNYRLSRAYNYFARRTYGERFVFWFEGKYFRSRRISQATFDYAREFLPVDYLADVEAMILKKKWL